MRSSFRWSLLFRGALCSGTRTEQFVTRRGQGKTNGGDDVRRRLLMDYSRFRKMADLVLNAAWGCECDTPHAPVLWDQLIRC